MGISDVIGFNLDKAVEVLKNEGYTVLRVKLTAPPKFRSNGHNSNSRVLKINKVDERQVELLVCNPSN